MVQSVWEREYASNDHPLFEALSRISGRFRSKFWGKYGASESRARTPKRTRHDLKSKTLFLKERLAEDLIILRCAYEPRSQKFGSDHQFELRGDAELGMQRGKGRDNEGKEGQAHRILLEFLVHVGEGVVHHAVVRFVRP